MGSRSYDVHSLLRVNRIDEHVNTVTKYLQTVFVVRFSYPPFFSNFHKGPLSPGMKERIVKGDYEYPAAEWSSVSKEAKDLIDKMLETDPHKRCSIDEVMKSQWLLVSAASTKSADNLLSALLSSFIQSSRTTPRLPPNRFLHWVSSKATIFVGDTF